MTKFLFLFLAGFAIFFIGCGDENTPDTKTCEPACESWQTCNNGTCELTAGKCVKNDDCKADTAKPVCDMTKHECVADNTECTTNEDCTDTTKPVCDNGTCVADTPECTTNEDCTDTAKPVCDNGVCVEDNTPECTTNEDCTDTAKPVCDNGVCVEDNIPECTTNEDCTDTAKPVCDNGVCVEDNTPECTTNEDCTDTAKPVCDNGVCVEDNTPECENQCLDQNSVVQGTCSVVGGLPVCECNEGYLRSPNGLRCLEKISECNDETIACGGHGECVAENNGTLACECDADYVVDAVDPLLCVPTVECSNSNHNGICEATCEQCMDDGTGNWKCKVPDGERGCYRNFNDRCDPSLGVRNNPGCDASMICEGNTAEDGYCTVTNCHQDSDCETTYGDHFVCKYYGEGWAGICTKADDECFNADGTRKAGGNEGDPCSDRCQEADCNVGNLCLNNTCSKPCAGSTDLTCGTDRKCVDIAGDGGLYYCNGPVVGAGEDCLNAVCDNGLSCLGDQQTWANCFKPCTTVGSTSECASVGTGSKCENFGQVGNFCGAPQTQQPGEECDQFSHGCVNDDWCLGTGQGASYCFEKCTVASDASNECTGNTACIHFGTAPNDGYYCDVVPSKNTGEECNIANTCLNDGWCLNTGQGNTSYCFDKCETAAENSSECNNQACIHFGTAPNDGNYCAPVPSKDLGESCDAVNTCMNDALCLSIADETQCFEKCQDAASVCTQTNYVCTDTGSVDIGWVCIPSSN